MSCKLQTGGMFNSYKVKYSPETHNLLKVLMEEAKLTSAQRSQIKTSMKKGEPLPIVSRRMRKPSYVDENLFDLKKNFYFLRRSKDQIIRSGAYERDRHVFLDRIVDLEEEKERLRNIMSKEKSKAKTKISAESKAEFSKEITPEERVEELIAEIEDRLDFLKDMETLGQFKKYEFVIKQEIAGKLREVRNLDKNAEKKFSQYFVPQKSKAIVIENENSKLTS